MPVFCKFMKNKIIKKKMNKRLRRLVVRFLLITALADLLIGDSALCCTLVSLEHSFA